MEATYLVILIGTFAAAGALSLYVVFKLYSGQR